LNDLLDALQWPAMAVTLGAAWLVSSRTRRRRNWGFWCFVLSNVLWVAWGWHERAYALIGLQLGLFVLNLRGVKKNEPADANGQPDPGAGQAS
jgi:hypothetical protein